jgi:hypothetical protein
MNRSLYRKTPLATLTAVAIAAALAAPSTAPASEIAPIAEAESSKEAHRVADRFVGDHRFQGGDKERKARDAAIDSVVDDMSIFARGIARDRLRESNKIAERIAIARNGDRVSFTHDGRRYTALLGGPPVRVKSSTGDEVSLRYALRGGTIEQIFVGEQGSRTNTFKLTDQKMTVHVRIHSEKLPKDVVYTLSYSR